MTSTNVFTWLLFAICLTFFLIYRLLIFWVGGGGAMLISYNSPKSTTIVPLMLYPHITKKIVRATIC